MPEKKWTEVYKKLDPTVTVETATGNTFVLRRPTNLQVNLLVREINALIKVAKNAGRGVMDAELLRIVLPELLVEISGNSIEKWNDADFDAFIDQGLEMSDTKQLVEEFYVLQGNDRDELKKIARDFQ